VPNVTVPVLHTLLACDEVVYASPDDVAEQHRPVLDAIRTGDPDLASRFAIAHCDGAREKVAPYFEQPAHS
jgi:DNA-binding GntR family transcriptional regulator